MEAKPQQKQEETEQQPQKTQSPIPNPQSPLIKLQ